MTDAPQPQPHDEHHRQTQSARQVRHILIRIHGYSPAAHTLDDDTVHPIRQRQKGLRNPLQINPLSRLFCRQMGRYRWLEDIRIHLLISQR